jgi:hypothetical protein
MREVRTNCVIAATGERRADRCYSRNAPKCRRAVRVRQGCFGLRAIRYEMSNRAATTWARPTIRGGQETKRTLILARFSRQTRVTHAPPRVENQSAACAAPRRSAASSPSSAPTTRMRALHSDARRVRTLPRRARTRALRGTRRAHVRSLPSELRSHADGGWRQRGLGGQQVRTCAEASHANRTCQQWARDAISMNAPSTSQKIASAASRAFTTGGNLPGSTFVA